MDDKLLHNLGLSQKEIKVYKAVLKAPSITPALLAKRADIKRTTAYAVTRGLVEKGFLVEDSTKRPAVFILADPSDIEEVIERNRRLTADKEKVLKQFAAELSRTTASDIYTVPQIRFVEESRMEGFLNSRALVWDQSMLKADATCWGFFDPTYIEAFPKVIDKYWKLAPKAINLKMLTNSSGAGAEKQLTRKYPRRTVKVWDKAQFNAAIWIMGNYVLTVQTRRHPFYATEIHDAMLAHDLREVFKNLWALV
jgi:predicted transcriptional regulator